MTCTVLNLALVAMIAVITPSSAREFTQEDQDLCYAKSTVVSYAYTNRDVVTKSEAMRRLDVHWKASWSHMHHATYVDMRRIIEGAYRLNGGKYRREACVAGETHENSETCKALIQGRMNEECRDALEQGF